MTNPITFYNRKNLAQIHSMSTTQGTPLDGAKNAAIATAAGGTNPQKLLNPLPTTPHITATINSEAAQARTLAARQPGATQSSISKVVNAAIKQASCAAGILLMPADQLKVMFDTITAHPATRNPLPSTIPLTEKDIFVAGINCGYMPRYKNWHPLNWKKIDRLNIAKFLKSNIKHVSTILEYQKNKPTKISSILSKLETSDKVNISFTLGNIATYLAAKAWIEASGDKIDMMLHERLYCAATSQLSSSKQRHADYIAITPNTAIHVFESKGGSSRNEAVISGLGQLDATAMHMLNGIRIKNQIVQPASYVCVHAYVSGGKDINIVAYDPPGDVNSKNEFGDLTMDIDYLFLAKCLDAIDLFEALCTSAHSQDQTGVWQTGHSEGGGGIRIAISHHMMTMQEEIRGYLMLKDFTRSIDPSLLNNPESTAALIKKFKKACAPESNYIGIRWHLKEDNVNKKTINSILKSAKKNAMMATKMEGVDFKDLISPFEQPTEQDFILDHRGLTRATDYKYRFTESIELHF